MGSEMCIRDRHTGRRHKFARGVQRLRLGAQKLHVDVARTAVRASEGHASVPGRFGGHSIRQRGATQNRPICRAVRTPRPSVAAGKANPHAISWGPWSWTLAPWGGSGLDCASRCPFGWCLVSSGFPAFAVCSLGSVLASSWTRGCWALPGLGSGFLMLPGLGLLTTLSDFGRKWCRKEELGRA